MKFIVNLFKKDSTKIEKLESNLSWSERLKNGLAKTSDNLGNKIGKIFGQNKLNKEILSQIEEILIEADIGVKTTKKIIDNLQNNYLASETSLEEVRVIIRNEIENILLPFAKELTILDTNKPHVIIVNGVNGVGKTTTIGKLAKKFTDNNKKVMIAACDTFRAAASDQISVWAERSGATLIRAETDRKGDAASIAYKALEKAKQENYDILLIDTAGRLQNRKDLMEELAKIIRVIKKIEPSAPHNSLLVIDATTGQNAKNQLSTFKEFASIDGIIVTKLDGTAKGGILVALAEEFKTNIYNIGVGEKIDDLNSFSASEFAKAII